MNDENTIPTWGYDECGGVPKLFHLKDGEGLPDGYEDTPANCASPDPVEDDHENVLVAPFTPPEEPGAKPQSKQKPKKKAT